MIVAWWPRRYLCSIGSHRCLPDCRPWQSRRCNHWL